MKTSPEMILNEARSWSKEEVRELVDLLNSQLLMEAEPHHDSIWKKEVKGRLEEIESNTHDPIPGTVVSEKIRKMVHR